MLLLPVIVRSAYTISLNHAIKSCNPVSQDRIYTMEAIVLSRFVIAVTRPMREI